MGQSGRPRRSEERLDSPFGKALRELLHERRLYEKELAELTGIDPTLLSKMIKGERLHVTRSLRDRLRLIIKALYQKKPLTLEEANSLLTSITALKELDQRDKDDATIIEMLETPIDARQPPTDQNHRKSVEEPGPAKEHAEVPSHQSETISSSDESKDERNKNARHATVRYRIVQQPYTSFLTAVIVLVLAVGGIRFLTSVTFPLHPERIQPGGAWMSPVEQIVGDTVHFAAYAYPTHSSEPGIDHVNFTALWQGVDPRAWKVVCVAHTPIRKDVFACDANIRKLGAHAGQISISFDVYDRQGNVNLAPNGKHTVTYSPSNALALSTSVLTAHFSLIS